MTLAALLQSLVPLGAGTGIGWWLTAWVKSRPHMLEAENHGADAFQGRLTDRIDKLERAAWVERERCDAEIDVLRQEVRVIQADLNTKKQWLAGAIALAIHAPERVVAYLLALDPTPAINVGLEALANTVERKDRL